VGRLRWRSFAVRVTRDALGARVLAGGAEARKLQATVKGTFIGETAFGGGRVRPYNFGHDCPDVRLVRVGLVWKKHANFIHSGARGAPRDGPRKALLLTLDPGTGHECASTASYRHVGACPSETLLYGWWPGRSGEG
jgi:hypothetical protein